MENLEREVYQYPNEKTDRESFVNKIDSICLKQGIKPTVIKYEGNKLIIEFENLAEYFFYYYPWDKKQNIMFLELAGHIEMELKIKSSQCANVPQLETA